MDHHEEAEYGHLSGFPSGNHDLNYPSNVASSEATNSQPVEDMIDKYMENTEDNVAYTVANASAGDSHDAALVAMEGAEEAERERLKKKPADMVKED
ncbi:hypothetical protein P154DRAFT_575103 [Amniculicola lignicola CBS 123094]|uniref:Uncharacterized protein n=1 Tax=Amniculicola lignicola CBS 123094 TaxID=1392246 RepID=A0A6A5WI80_9PLEO|nr:hypothetical protein P154DRAFT_575103 [Amniculicola lignicola CBS 123094]